MSGSSKIKRETVCFIELCSKLVNGGTPSTENSNYWNGKIPWITGADFTSKGIGRIRRYVSESGIQASATSVVQPGNLLVVTRTGVGKIAIAQEAIAISQDITGVYLDSNRVDVRFAYYLLLRELDEIGKLNQGTSIKGIIRSDLENHRISIPKSVDVQRKIAQILNTIDHAIASTETLIEKYQLIKAGLMHDLFTRGIGADGKLRSPRDQAPELYKESAIGWIPKEWGLSFLSHALGRIDSGWSPSCPEIPPGIGEWGVLKVSSVTKGFYDCLESKTLPTKLKPIPFLEVKDGDVIMTRANGVAELVGKCVQVSNTQTKLMLSDKLLRLSSDPTVIDNDYLGLLMCSDQIKTQIDKAMNGSSGQRNISQADIRNFACPIPCRDEQKLISHRLLRHTNLAKKESAFLERD